MKFEVDKNIGQPLFNSPEEAKTYKKAMNLKRNTIELARNISEMMDDKVDIDFNDKTKGDILFENQPIKSICGKNFSGRVIFDKDNNMTFTSMDVKGNSGIEDEMSVHYKATRDSGNNYENYQLDIEESGDFQSFLHQELIIDHKHNTVEFNESHKPGSVE